MTLGIESPSTFSLSEAPPPSIIPLSASILNHMQSRVSQAEDTISNLAALISSASTTQPDRSGGDNISSEFGRLPTSSQKMKQPSTELLASKLHHVEMTLQALKMNMASLATLKREPSQLEGKLCEMADSYQAELGKMRQDSEVVRRVGVKAKEEVERLEEEKLKLEETLKDAIVGQHELSARCRGLDDYVESLTRRVSIVQSELAAERTVRGGLERAHKLLLQQTGGVGEGGVVSLHQALSNALVELAKERSSKEEAQAHVCQLKSQLEKQSDAVYQGLTEREMMAGELGKANTQYQLLHCQLEGMQSLFNTLQTEKSTASSRCSSLQEEVEEKKREVSRLEAELERSKVKDETSKVIQLRERLRKQDREMERTSKENETLMSDLAAARDDLEKSHQEARNAHGSQQLMMSQEHAAARQAGKRRELMMSGELTQLKQTVVLYEAERSKVMADKESLLKEIDEAVVRMGEEKESLQDTISSLQTRLSEEELEKERCLKEIKQLKEQIDVLQLHQYDTDAMAEVVEQRGRLAHENGQLKVNVDQLQATVQSLSSTQGDNSKLRQEKEQSDRAVKKMEAERDAACARLVDCESQLMQAGKSFHTAEAERVKVTQAKERLEGEGKSLRETRDRLSQKLSQLEVEHQHSLESMRGDNSKVTESLENMIALHTELQCAFEKMQVELNKKSTALYQTEGERGELAGQLSQIAADLMESERKLANAAGLEKQLSRLRDQIEQSKKDNSKLVMALKDAMQAVSGLEKEIGGRQEAIDTLKSELNTLARERQRDREEGERENQELRERIGRERDKAYTKMEKDFTAVRRETDRLLEKNSELLEANLELQGRSRLAEEERKKTAGALIRVRDQAETASELRERLGECQRTIAGLESEVSSLEGCCDAAERREQEQMEIASRLKEGVRSLQTDVSRVKQALKRSEEGRRESEAVVMEMEQELKALQRKHMSLKERYNRLRVELKVRRRVEVEIEKERRPEELDESLLHSITSTELSAPTESVSQQEQVHHGRFSYNPKECSRGRIEHSHTRGRLSSASMVSGRSPYHRQDMDLAAKKIDSTDLTRRYLDRLTSPKERGIESKSVVQSESTVHSDRWFVHPEDQPERLLQKESEVEAFKLSDLTEKGTSASQKLANIITEMERKDLIAH